MRRCVSQVRPRASRHVAQRENCFSLMAFGPSVATCLDAAQSLPVQAGYRGRLREEYGRLPTQMRRRVHHRTRGDAATGETRVSLRMKWRLRRLCSEQALTSQTAKPCQSQPGRHTSPQSEPHAWTSSSDCGLVAFGSATEVAKLLRFTDPSAYYRLCVAKSNLQKCITESLRAPN